MLQMLDVGGGSGGFALTLARLYPKLRLTVLDFENVVGVGREFAAKEGEVSLFPAHNALDFGLILMARVAGRDSSRFCGWERARIGLSSGSRRGAHVVFEFECW